MNDISEEDGVLDGFGAHVALEPIHSLHGAKKSDDHQTSATKAAQGPPKTGVSYTMVHLPEEFNPNVSKHRASCPPIFP